MARIRISTGGIASFVHEVWANWMRYQFSIGTFNADGTWAMPAWAVKRWQRQMDTPYSELPPEEQASDIEIAVEYIKRIDEANERG